MGKTPKIPVHCFFGKSQSLLCIVMVKGGLKKLPVLWRNGQKLWQAVSLLSLFWTRLEKLTKKEQNLLEPKIVLKNQRNSKDQREYKGYLSWPASWSLSRSMGLCSKSYPLRLLTLGCPLALTWPPCTCLKILAKTRPLNTWKCSREPKNFQRLP